MTIEEFSNMFDTLLNSYNTQAVFGEQVSQADIVLDEYEKSVLLTQAQDLVIKSYFNKATNTEGQGFDDSTLRQMDFSSLITVAHINQDSSSGATTFDDRGIMFTLPSGESDSPKVLLILNEKLKITVSGASKSYVVVPINYQEYDRQMSKAYTQPLKKQCWRLFDSNASTTLKSEIIPIAAKKESGATYQYILRYVRRPQPIILANLSNDGLSIDGKSVVTPCELSEIIHMDILNKAVELALATRGNKVPVNQANQ